MWILIALIVLGVANGVTQAQAARAVIELNKRDKAARKASK